MSLDQDLDDLDRMALGKAVDFAGSTAKKAGHVLGDWEEGRKSSGMFWSAVCSVCGAMAMAEFDAMGYAVSSGNTQRMTCRSVQRKTQRARERRAKKA